MAKYKGIQKINSLRQRWVTIRVLSCLLLAAAIALVSGGTLRYLFGISEWWLVVLFMLSIGVLFIVARPWLVTDQAVSSFLNNTYPELEESAELSLKPAAELTLLQSFQLDKIDSLLIDLPALPKQIIKPLNKSVLWLLGAIIVYVCLSFLPHRTASGSFFSTQPSKTNTHKEKVLPQIDGMSISITPPVYTGKSARTQDRFTILAEEGAQAQWKLNTNIAVKNISLIFNEHEKIALKSNADQTTWTTSKSIDKPGFYQVNIDGKLSDLYQVEIIKDTPPVLHVKSPKQYTYIDAGEIPRVTLNTDVTDDYGVAGAMIYATVAKGTGEAVKFKEYKLDFGTPFTGRNKQYTLQKVFDLPKFDMEPGDELYFYVEAQDNHLQKSRTDVYTVTLQDTAQLLSMDGLVNGSNLKPEFFRSERQIIMDTEHLLKTKDAMPADKFKDSCNNIGIDQKLLRLRYGKFLGEEDESNVGGAEEGAQAELAKVENFNNAQMLLDAYTDKHDNAEDATFLEPAIKAQLKETLTEMWKAELQLRLYNPQAALPFEYKALRLLKDLQQKSRSYVAKTAYKPTPLKQEKRLTGDLSKIIAPSNHQDIKPLADDYVTLKNAVQLLEQIKIAHNYADAGRRTLQLAKQQLSLKASAEPGIYLTAVAAMNRILASAQKVDPHDADLVEKAIQRAIPASKQLPQGARSNADMGLSNSYYQNLKRSR